MTETPIDPANGAAFFDVDRTLVAGASALTLARPFRERGLLSRRQQLRAGLVQLAFMFKGADDDGIERFTASAKELIQGWDVAMLESIVADEIERRVHPTVFREALERIDLHHRQGQPVYAVSATMEQIIQPLADLLGLDGGVGSRMHIEDGVFTGDVEIAAHGAGKAQQLRELAEREGIDLATSSAYSDSISDEPFLRAVGRPYAVNPDKALRKLAEAEGWGILTFRTRVQAPLHHRRGARASVAVAAIALGMRAWARRRNRRKAP